MTATATPFLPMHVKELGFRRNPFPYTPDAQNYFLTEHVERRFAELMHCILARKGFFLLTSDIGLGKSTLVRRLLMTMQQKQIRCALVVNTFLQGPELLSAIVSDFGLQSAGDLYQDHKTLNDFLLRMHQEGTTCLVVIDDAQNLSKSSLEMIRLLSNLETDQEKLIQILLVGQQELEVQLSSHDLRQLRSRIANHVRLNAFTLQESLDYVDFRLAAAMPEASQHPIGIDREAGRMLWEAAGGVPRIMHVLLDRCLYGLMTQRSLIIDSRIVKQAIEETQYLRGTLAADALPVHHAQKIFQSQSQRSWLASKLVQGFALAGLAMLVLGAWFVYQQGGSSSDAFLAVSHSKAHIPSNAPVQVAKVTDPAIAVVESHKTSYSVSPALSPTSAAAPNAPKAEAETPMVDKRKTDVLAACASEPKWLEAANGDGAVQSAKLSSRTWSLIGERLRPHSIQCFDQAANEYRIAWRAQNNPLAFPAGREIAKYQIALSNFGSLAASEVDGILGVRTIESVNLMQKQLGMEVTGRLDPLTVLILNKVFLSQ